MPLTLAQRLQLKRDSKPRQYVIQDLKTDKLLGETVETKEPNGDVVINFNPWRYDTTEEAHYFAGYHGLEWGHYEVFPIRVSDKERDSNDHRKR